MILFSQKLVQAFIDLKSEINVMKSSFAKKLGFYIWRTEVGTNKIDNSRLETFEIVVVSSLINNKVGRL